MPDYGYPHPEDVTPEVEEMIDSDISQDSIRRKTFTEAQLWQIGATIYSVGAGGGDGSIAPITLTELVGRVIHRLRKG